MRKVIFLLSSLLLTIPFLGCKDVETSFNYFCENPKVISIGWIAIIVVAFLFVFFSFRDFIREVKEEKKKKGSVKA